MIVLGNILDTTECLGKNICATVKVPKHLKDDLEGEKVRHVPNDQTILMG